MFEGARFPQARWELEPLMPISEVERFCPAADPEADETEELEHLQQFPGGVLRYAYLAKAREDDRIRDRKEHSP